MGASGADTTFTDAGQLFRFSATGFVQLSAASVNEHGVLTVTASFADLGDDSHTVLIEWGDGSAQRTLRLPPGVTSFSAAHRYRDDDPSGTPADSKAVRVRVLDENTNVLTTHANGLLQLDGRAPEPFPRLAAGLGSCQESDAGADQGTHQQPRHEAQDVTFLLHIMLVIHDPLPIDARRPLLSIMRKLAKRSNPCRRKRRPECR